MTRKTTKDTANGDGEHVETLLTKGYAFLKKGNLELAQSNFEKALKRETSIRTLSAAALVSEQLNQIPRATNYYQTILNSFPEHHESKNRLAALKKKQSDICEQLIHAVSAKNAELAIRLFKEHFGWIHLIPKMVHYTGQAYFQKKDFATALQYFQQVTYGSLPEAENTALLARCHLALHEFDLAEEYARLALTLKPSHSPFFELYSEICQTTEQPEPQHWLVIADSHARYFTYMQLNQQCFFKHRLFFEVYEFGGASAYGLMNQQSRTGARAQISKLRARIAKAQRILLNFGEVDCRRAIWKASVDLGKPVDELVHASAEHLIRFADEIIAPINGNIILVGAKPQIINDGDHYAISLRDERTIFKPLEERQRLTDRFNSILEAMAKRHGYLFVKAELPYHDGQQLPTSDCFFDTFTTDTHGNLDYFAKLHCDAIVNSGIIDSPKHQSHHPMKTAEKTWTLKIGDHLSVVVPADLKQQTTFRLLEHEDSVEPELAWLKRVIKPGMCLLDTKSDLGIYTLSLAHYLQGNGRLLIRHPHPLLSQSIAINSLDSVIYNDQGEKHFDFIRAVDHPLEKAWLDQSDALILFNGSQLPSHQTLIGNAGLSVYQLLPSLGALVPYKSDDHEAPARLFCCSQRRATNLAEQGLLVAEHALTAGDDKTPLLTEPSDWASVLQSYPFVMSSLEERIDSNPANLPQAFVQALQSTLFAQDQALPLANRYHALRQAADRLKALSDSGDEHPCTTFIRIRVLSDLGQNQQAMALAEELAAFFAKAQDRLLDRPLLAPLASLDQRVKPDQVAVKDWLQAALIETQERLSDESSDAQPAAHLPRLAKLHALKCASPAMERRLALCALRLGKTIKITPESQLMKTVKNRPVWEQIRQGLDEANPDTHPGSFQSNSTDRTNPEGKYLYLSVEVGVRELESKLLLALLGIKRGYYAIVAKDMFFNIAQKNFDHLPPGIFFAKSFHSIDRNGHFLHAKHNGTFVTGIDEEGENDFNFYSQRRYDKGSVSVADAIFNWGPHSLDTLKQTFPDYETKFLPMGSPRIDLLRPEGLGYFAPTTEAIKEIFEDFLLINLNSCIENKALDEFQKKVIYRMGMVKESNRALFEKYHKRRRDYGIKQTYKLLQFAEIYAKKYPHRRIIIRPHPNDQSGRLQALAGAFSNIKIINQGSPQPWILASTMMISTSCTTNVEAYFLGHPTVSYVPIKDPELNDQAKSNKFCPVATTEVELDAFIEKNQDSPDWFKDHHASTIEIARQLFYGVGDTELVSEKILDVFDQLILRDQPRKRATKPLDLAALNFDHGESDYKFQASPFRVIQEKVRRLASAYHVHVPYTLEEIGPRAYLIRPA